MKKFIPYILIVAMVGTFLWVAFSGPFSGTVLGPNKALASGDRWYDSALDEVVVYGKYIWEDPLRIVPGYAIGENISAWGDWGKISDATIGQMLAWISSFTWYVSAKIFTLSGYLLDYAVDFAVKDFKTHIEQISVIDTGYKIILNVANMLFIFILLYIAIKTILGMGGDTKKLLTNIIVVGLFINFSLFMTKTIIDASNIVAMGFYNAVRTEFGQTKNEGSDGQKKIVSVGSISTAMMAGLKLQTQIPSPESTYNKKDSYKGLTNFNITVNNLAGSALFLISAFVFISVALLFIVRFVALLFYLLFSPVAFLGMISPELKEYSTKWWKGLQSQAIFAPAFLFLIYLISAIINSDDLWKAVGGDKDSSSTYYDFISGSGQMGGFPVIMNYVILMALMIGALIVAKTMASQGSAGMVGYAQKFQGWAQGVAGRNTLGRAAYLAGNNRYMAKLMAKSPTLGNFAKTQFDNVAGQKFGSKTGYATALKKSTDQKKKMADFVANSDQKEASESLRKEERMLDEKNEFRRKQIKKVYDTQKERDRLSDIANNSYNPADFVALSDFERDTLQKEKDILKDAERDIEKINTNIGSLKTAQKNISYIANREYAKNVEFDSSILNKLFPSGADAAAEIRKGKKSVREQIKSIIEEDEGGKKEKAEGEGTSEKKESGGEKK